MVSVAQSVAIYFCCFYNCHLEIYGYGWHRIEKKEYLQLQNFILFLNRKIILDLTFHCITHEVCKKKVFLKIFVGGFNLTVYYPFPYEVCRTKEKSFVKHKLFWI